MPYTGGEDHTPWDFMSDEERAAKEREWKGIPRELAHYRFFIEETGETSTLWRVIRGQAPEWQASDGSWQPNERRTSFNKLLEYALESDHLGVPLIAKNPLVVDPEDAPGSLADLSRRLSHVRYYLESLGLHESVKKDLNKLLHGYEPNGNFLTKDSPRVGPDWRMIEALKHQ